ncbi:DUF6174 domain-containing protein [Actinoplanes awajinensis]|nr:DUF6174 domain-containing protein [Actinoplanes awajinensis]
MTDLRPRRAALLTVTAALTLSGCSSTPSGTTVRAVAGTLPDHYSYVVTASCGERAVIGTFRIVVRDRDVVVSAEPADPESTVQVPLASFPTLKYIVEQVESAEPDAVVEFTTDAAGRPAHVSIDHRPNAIDDEECYDITDIQPLPSAPVASR